MRLLALAVVCVPCGAYPAGFVILTGALISLWRFCQWMTP